VTAPGGAAAETDAGQATGASPEAAGPDRAHPAHAHPAHAHSAHAHPALPSTPPGSATWRAASLRTQGFVSLRGQRAAARSRWTAALAGRRVPDLAGAVTDAGFATGWRVVRALPEPFARQAFRLGADLAARRDGPGAHRLRGNLHRVVPDATPDELDALVRAGLRSYARYWCEAFRLPAMDRAAVLARMDPNVTGMAPMFEALQQGRGVVAALPHSGNWDLAGLWFVETQRRMGRPARFTTVVERLRPESLYRRFVAYRESLGFEVLAVGDGPVVYRTLTQRLREGGLVCLVADRDLSASGLEVSFFGEPARLPTGPARLAALTGALLVPAFPSFTPDGWAAAMGAPIPVPERGGRDDVAKATQALADALASLIATAPHDWHMLQRVWSADLQDRGR
jgi:phosphatidylinositol dimannoside acyltransferase